ncbi:hypothetical protein DEO72_LG5g1306 [Vigna unguiculata]|uniref:Uncharacterized protein n=1 Tax=Vigna unguiculata TaxID=3917 RepID=A0A4D6LZH4_VIGUN|nr:hypothetical protein DEO72_LG5g1306 [Vigna unguiculata]
MAITAFSNSSIESGFSPAHQKNMNSLLLVRRSPRGAILVVFGLCQAESTSLIMEKLKTCHQCYGFVEIVKSVGM